LQGAGITFEQKSVKKEIVVQNEQNDDILSCVSGVTNPIKRHKYTNDTVEAKDLASSQRRHRPVKSSISQRKKAVLSSLKVRNGSMQKEVQSPVQMQGSQNMAKLMQNVYANGCNPSHEEMNLDSISQVIENNMDQEPKVLD
jgi:hypothetical protein